MTTPHAQVPNPVPDPEIGEEGYEMWCLAAEYRPRWLASLNDPHRHFTHVQTKYNQLVDDHYEQLSTPSQSEQKRLMNLEVAHAAARRAIVAELPEREVTEPVWDHLDPMENPALDEPVRPVGAPEDWTPAQPTVTELMVEEIKHDR